MKMEAAEQYSACCLRIAGVPKNEAENTYVYVMALARTIDAEITLDDIDRSHRVGPIREGHKRDIILQVVAVMAPKP